MIEPIYTRLNINRIELSEFVLAGWAHVMGLGAMPAENVRLIENEIEALQALTDQPERRATLIGRYEVLAAELRQAIN